MKIDTGLANESNGSFKNLLKDLEGKLYEDNTICLVKHDTLGIVMYFDDVADKNCRYMRFDKDLALKLAKIITDTYKET